MAVQAAHPRVHRNPANIVLRTLVAAGLVVDAVVHLHLAPGYQEASPGGIGLGTLFILQAVTAVGAALYVITRGTRSAYLIALLVAAAALVAVLLSRYVDLPAIGPLPAMYEPLWFPEKAVSAVAEALAAALAATALATTALTRKPPRRPAAT